MAENTAFRDIPFMGVIRVVVEAMKLGYRQEDPSWANLGQGQPEVGPLPGAPPRMDHVPVLPGDYAYGPVEGLPELREAVAAHYNRLYRRGMPSQYKAENVVVAAGGRTSLTRGAAALDEGRLGYFIPDYTAYEDLLTAFRRFTPVLAGATQDAAFRVDPKELDARISHAHLSALILSNPCNPTGRTIKGPELAEWVAIARRRRCTLLMDEYYSHFTYGASADEAAGPVSTAAFVEDVNGDPVVIFDGLTKNYRYPGWRVGWAVGPVEAVRAMTAGGSFVDGGPPRPMQRAAVEILEPSRADQETEAVRKEFRRKRDLTIERLTAMGVTLPRPPEGTFYAFGCVRDLPPPLNDGVAFHYESMKHRVLTVPGEYFDVNPFRSRPGPSPLAGYVRFSFGPPMKTLSEGLDRLAEMVRRARG
ncbi:MAG: pyridoxal phosphate-dependent aminotransferase [Phycisphaerales bacterium]|nr:MAG: pyridoxal phosphate-dependent aminotransferase [Phycisphaerales bacterium]